MAKYVTQCKLKVYDSPRAGRIAIVTMDNGEDHKKPNTWGEEALRSLDAVLDVVEKDTDLKGWILTGKPYIFNVGADIMSVNLSATREEAIEAGRQGHAVFSRIMNLKIPTVAAINGASMGGGFEVALYHDYRTVSSSPGGADHIALPECFINLIPGWGGTQLVPRIGGVAAAIELMLTNPLSQNRMTNSHRVFELGLADRIFPPAEFLDDSIGFLEDIITGTEKVEIRRKDAGEAISEQQYQETLQSIRDKVHAGTQAPYRILDLIRDAATLSLQEGFAKEDEALAEMITSRQFKASVYAFDLVQRRAKKLPGRPEGIAGHKIAKIGVIGAGLMASQMALLFMQRFQVPVMMKDIQQAFVDKGIDYIKGQLARQVDKGRLGKADADWMADELLTGTVTYDGFEECDFVIEGVFEEMGIKQKVFGELEAVCKPECLFMTNTSSLDVTEMASRLKDPSRVVGFHFFNPIAVLPLIEIIKAEQTSDLTLATAFDVAKRIKKTPVLVKNSAGFLVNRVLLSMMDGVMACLDEGADFQQTDNAVVELGFPMSPFVLLQLVGPAVGMHVQETLHAAWPDRFRVYEGLKWMVANKKTGLYILTEKGFEIDPEITANWPQGARRYADDEIREQVLVRVAVEIDQILKEGVVASYKDVDTGMIMGTGWPFFNGGITALLDHDGYSEKALGRRIQS
jgi:3-hydroxyacyl-CoA dehydrogenase/enoyl-CoA hydratase/carnithine racemase